MYNELWAYRRESEAARVKNDMTFIYDSRSTFVIWSMETKQNAKMNVMCTMGFVAAVLLQRPGRQVLQPLCAATEKLQV